MTTKLLAIDTSTENCSAALQVGQQRITRVLESPREHSQKLLPFVQDLLTEAEVSLKQLDGLVVGCGPGSFTGVRIGVSIGQGLAFSQQLPVYPVSSLQALAQQCIRRYSMDNSNKASQPDIVLACIDARMEEVYYAIYETVDGFATPLTEPAVAKPSPQLFKQHLSQLQLADDVVIATAGTGWDQYADSLSSEIAVLEINGSCRLPEAEDMLSLVLAGKIKSVSADHLEPLYVRNEVTWKKLPGR